MTDIASATRHLCEALRFETVSQSDFSQVDAGPFTAFEAFLADSYPLVHERLAKTVINQHGLVFHWRGQTSGKPVLITAHYDVVPADGEGWPQPPFSGALVDGKIYGRGAFDDKGSLIAIMEAVSALLAEGFVPQRDIVLAFGFDEEVGGARGAQQIAAVFKAQGLHFDYVLDEGGAVADGQVMGIARPIAVIGIAEKGNASFRLHFEGAGGHSSTPPDSTAVGRMAAFVHAVESHPQKPRLTPTVRAMLKAIAPYQKGIQRFVMSRPELFSPLILKSMAKNRQTAAMLRTTTAFTMAGGGTSHNVLPQSASCTVNIRTLQGDSWQDCLKRFHALGIPFREEPLLQDNPTRASSLDSAGMAHLERTIAAVFPDAVITPYLMVGGTDCRHYEAVADNSYRFLPARVSEQELSLMHGRGEYLSVDNLRDMIQFYSLFIRNIGG